MDYDEKREDVKIFKDYGVFILYESYKIRTIKGDALGELVK
jgi:hypothetical protein